MIARSVGVADCEGCGLNGYPEVPWQVPVISQYPILIVGQAPGDIEGVTKKPFTGSAGKMCWRVLKEAGIDKERVHITNVCCCCPPKKPGTNDDRPPTLDEVRRCHDRLKAEILECKPEYIIAFGEIPMIALCNKSKPKTHRGQWYPLLESYEYECMVMCTLHPSFLLRQRQWIEIVIDDLRAVQQACETGRVEPHHFEVQGQPKWIYDPSESELAHHLERYSPYVTATDIETPSELNMRKAEIIGISFSCDGEEAVCVDFTTGHNDPRWKVVGRFLSDKKARKCTQNGGFDIGCLETHDMLVNTLAWDTLYAEHTINSDLPGNLDFLRSRYTKIQPYKPSKQEMKEFAHWPKEKRLEYNGWDSITTWQVMQQQIDVMTEGQQKVLHEIEIPLIWVFNKMERRGVKIDMDWMALAFSQINPEALRIEAEYFTPLGLNPRSPIQLKQHFGIDSTGEDELVRLIKRRHPQSELMQAVLDYRGMNKAATMIHSIYQRLDNGRVHTHFKIEGTGTGRPASEDPNLNNVPKWLRAMFVADDGKVWIEGDYTQQELHTIACVSGDRQLLRDLADGVNVHHNMGFEAFQRWWADLSDVERLMAKSITFGTAYGRTPRSIAMEFGVSIATAESWQVKCINKYPGLVAYRNRAQEEFDRTGRCHTEFGRVRIIQSQTQGFNTPIQGTAADITNTTLIKLHKMGFDMRLTVYDSIVIQAEERDAEDVAYEFRKVMERPMHVGRLGGHQFPAKFGYGGDWKELRSWWNVPHTTA